MDVPLFGAVGFGRFARFSVLEVVLRVRLAPGPTLVLICGGRKLDVDGGRNPLLRVIFSLIIIYFSYRYLKKMSNLKYQL